MSTEDKTESIEAFQNGKTRVLVTKGKIAGLGLNLQCAHKMCFVGMNDSMEMYYQCVRRSLRYGQEHDVDVHIVLARCEEPILRNVQTKEQEANYMMQELIAHSQEYQKAELKQEESRMVYREDEAQGESWKLYLGDSAERLKEVKTGTVGLSVMSPPFASLYVYSASERDLGNSKDEKEFFNHFRFIMRELMRVTMPGRICCIHVAQIPAMMVRDGYIGMKDFRGKTIETFEEEGWIYHGEVVIDKDPQAQAIRTKSKGLAFKELKKDSSWLRPCLADYILVFRKPGDNLIPILPDVTNDMWIEWARPIWYGIKESGTLNVAEARDNKDERHICALQLGTIERCIRLWSNKGETICSAFAGIGSEGYKAIELGRKFVGCELNQNYWGVGCKNLKEAERKATAGTLFAAVAE
jgi:DNA modification methylase